MQPDQIGRRTPVDLGVVGDVRKASKSLLERRHQTIRLRDRHWNPASVVSFRRRRPSPYERNAAISRHFERDPIPYALETDWPVGCES